jgi:TonB-dependent starch-binding outer membrane protein SusC
METTQRRLLSDVLRGLKKQYQTDILFFDRNVEGLWVAPGTISPAATLDQNLTRALTPHGLGFRVTSSKGYIITAAPKPKPTNNVPVGNVPNRPRTGPNLPDERLAANATSEIEAADVPITGRVVDVLTGDGLPGVSVLIKETGSAVRQRGTTTRPDGSFTLAVRDEAAVLVFSYVGYRQQALPIGAQTSFSVSLAQDPRSLEEVVVVGYGTVKRSDLTGAVASVSAEKSRQTVNTSPDQALAGRVAGVQVTQASGQPGGAVSVRIRGGNSLTGGNEPLYVIDGYPVYNDNGGASAGATKGPNLNALSTLNPSDIETIDVLKDASATAIYGTRGANGVVLITTRRGKIGQSRVEIDSYCGVQRLQKYINLLNATEFAGLVNEVNVGAGVPPTYTPNQLAAMGAGTDWQREIFRTAPIQNHQLTISGGDEKTRYALSAGYFNQQGIILNSDFDRMAVRLNLDRTVSQRLRVGTYLSLSRTFANQAITDTDGGALAGVVTGALTFPPTIPVYDATGVLTRTSTLSDHGSPVALARHVRNQVTTYRTLGHLFAEYELGAGLVLKTTLGTDLLVNKEDFYQPSFVRNGPATNGLGIVGTQLVANWLNENTLTYHRSAGKHSLNALAGFTAQQSKSELLRGGAQNFVSDRLGDDDLTGGATTTPTATRSRGWSLLSYLGRLNYQFDNRFMLTLTGRVDGSSRFGADSKWALFPSMALAWRVANEPFMKGQTVFYDLKLRGSVGVTGNQEIGLYQSLATVGTVTYTFNNALANGYRITRIANPNLRWERTRQYDLGLDASFLNGRLDFTADVYLKQTTDLLYDVPVPHTSGFATSLQNVGSTENRGIELALGGLLLDKPLRWRADVNIASNRNKVTGLGSAVSEFFTGGFTDRFKITDPLLVQVGQPIGGFYGYVADGIFRDQAAVDASAQKAAKPGDRRIRDLNQNGQIDPDDRTYLGWALPKFLGGFSQVITYKGLELSMLGQFSVGNSILNFNRMELETPSGTTNGSKALLDRWAPTSPAGTLPRADPNRTILLTDTFVEDGSYLRLKNLSLAYNLPTRLVQKAHLRTAKVYVSGQNLVTLTRYSGYDPEVNRWGAVNLSIGQDYGGYPIAQTLLGGVAISF